MTDAPSLAPDELLEYVDDDDGGDPFEGLWEGLSPQWQRLAGHVLAYFRLDDVPMMLRPFLPAMVRGMACKLGDDPAGSTAQLVTLLKVVVIDLELGREHFADLWGDDGRPALVVDIPSRG